MNRTAIWGSFLVLAVAGCQTPYGPRGRIGGYEENQVGDGVFEVSFYGNANTSEEKVGDFALLRAAELGQSMGYGYFTVVRRENRTKRTDTKVTRLNDDVLDEHGGILIGDHPIGHPEHSHYETVTSIEPGVMILVKYFEEHSGDAGPENQVLSCTETLQRLQTAYEIEAR